MAIVGSIGTVDAFDIMKNHIGHDISFNEYKEENVLVGVEAYCDTCQKRIFLKQTYSYAVREQVESNRATKLNAMTFEEWKHNFTRINGDRYEQSELSDLYDEYLSEIRREEPISEPWDTGQTTPTPRTYTTPSYATRNRVFEDTETGWGAGEDGWTV